MNRQQILKEIENRTEIGEAYVKSQVEFLKWAAKEALKRSKND